MNQNEKRLDLLVEIAKALSDSNRVRALMALRNGELCVCQLIELFKLAPSTVSKHMSILKQAGLVDSRKDSRWVYYRLSHEGNNVLIDRFINLIVSTVESDSRILSDKKEILQIQKSGIDSICTVKRNDSTSGNCCE